MAVIAPPAVTDLPLAPDPSDRSTFNVRAYPWSVALGPFSTQLQALANNVALNATDAYSSSTSAAAYAAATLADRLLAQTAANAAIGTTASMANSASSNSIGTGDKTFVLTETDRVFSPGQFFVAAVTASATTNYMTGQVKSFDAATDTVVFSSNTAFGSGTHAAWSLSVNAGPNNVVRVAYDDRATLRAMTPGEGASILLAGVGLFSFAVGSTEPDDDETCFVTSNGAWLIEAVSYDLVDAYLQQIIEDVTPQTIYKTFYSTVVTVSAGQRLSQTVDVPGVAVGDMVTISENPLSVNINIGSPLNGNCLFSAAVTATDTVTAYFQTPSSAGAWNALRIWDLCILKKVN